MDPQIHLILMDQLGVTPFVDKEKLRFFFEKVHEFTK